ncbi:glutathione S-transferase family protein [Sandarakinorhabdus rubra]|uniref:glutathione S-transferase family protein n=1 Tax=Sandarakinorhabdus rubra TaxID=2672568 RepID=UPI0013DABE34|nr:glutathione S-transferase family protein [Sandarakinorhabdus rubra]
MKLYDSIGPNPHVVRMAMAEKGITLPTETIDIMAGANRSGAYITKVPAGGTPALELDDGRTISEITVIAEYLEELHPTPALIGNTPEERAETRRWVRIIDLGYCEPMANGFRATQGRPMFEPRFPIVSESAGEELKAIAAKKLLWLDALMTGDFVCGSRFTLADILLFCFIEFGGAVGQPLPAGLKWLPAWRERVAARPSAKA